MNTTSMMRLVKPTLTPVVGSHSTLSSFTPDLSAETLALRAAFAGQRLQKLVTGAASAVTEPVKQSFSHAKQRVGAALTKPILPLALPLMAADSDSKVLAVVAGSIGTVVAVGAGGYWFVKQRQLRLAREYFPKTMRWIDEKEASGKKLCGSEIHEKNIALAAAEDVHLILSTSGTSDQSIIQAVIEIQEKLDHLRKGGLSDYVEPGHEIRILELTMKVLQQKKPDLVAAGMQTYILRNHGDSKLARSALMNGEND